ncbi:MAG: translation initiation factor IF-3 [Candidatus Staskawiczbacteria bacterium RIFOXYB2_FULL_32_9]|uniref:Translation initiation factor IF-3 n=1 Tax=Candidatus Staskawiczbacteria bacterium RIFOXYD1_FULL_32_13 TaxID=1802234 RepID=A0A1G2JNP8_9BACT|nr:MAG: Translation initiation factor IF-3 [Parcubacteria group bacterium GW2011_GWC2_32_10]OGZ77620.1 MAG: translation initiation factor IF-3 [Candidatus Staskawiczbacteria bacterium RIFOXYA2_FULL_32_7]OGZ78117.1 MAG: translation initiation factor IF-3 [Candidatus Staskawiczbacteria bacterium RIFOXYB1_FULL_32_11]OGZ82015.1 MAG: translation initiation factor IF-3 [Candidatus Staskawiczbacteria bacterium RIFOXYB2_FULL_32_9]OGZ86854.1 MAG: translation initiation factor IF-3 [Candidatus Staskawicz
MQNKTPINNFIKAKEVRVISETGEQLGIMDVFSAIDLAKSKSLDLIQVTEKVDPPVCRIGDYGKYLYSLQKKERKAKIKTKTELKEVRLGFNISPHDIETKAKQSEDFLKDGDKVKVSMVLKGREKAMGEYAKNKILLFLETVDKLTPIKIERELKREPRGFTLIISKA